MDNSRQEQQAISAATAWVRRWYYILQNRTSGKLYIGQTAMGTPGDDYLGSGTYWIPHCKKHGGYDRENICAVERVWIDNEVAAQDWLDEVETFHPQYWTRRDRYANQVPETTKSSPLAGEGGRIAVAKIHSVKDENGKSVAGVKSAAKTHSTKDENGKSVAAVKGGRIGGPKGAAKTHSIKDENGKSVAGVKGGRIGAAKTHSIKDENGKSVAGVKGGRIAAAKIHSVKDENGKSVAGVKGGRSSAALWSDSSIKEARIKRHAVKCNGTHFSSVAKALIANNIPPTRICKIRIPLVKQGSTTYTYGGQSYLFELAA